MLNDPATFSAKELGMEPQKYADWICGGNSAWGGIPELKALSMYFQTEFAVVVISDFKILVFGMGKGY
jgi:hypothetical protein